MGNEHLQKGRHLNIGKINSSSSTAIRIALIGDYNSASIAHRAIPLAIDLAAKAMHTDVHFFWFPTESLASNLNQYHAIWCVPGSPYQNMTGALNAITFARENRIPFLGTCGGFQHALIEYARKILLLPDSDHIESNPHTSLPLITPLACSLSGTKDTILLKTGSKIEKIYNETQIIEAFNCNFGLNPNYRHLLEKSPPLHITGVDQSGNVRVIELESHPFFIATLYQPERSALTDVCHPLIKAFIQAAKHVDL